MTTNIAITVKEFAAKYDLSVFTVYSADYLDKTETLVKDSNANLLRIKKTREQVTKQIFDLFNEGQDIITIGRDLHLHKCVVYSVLQNFIR